MRRETGQRAAPEHQLGRSDAEGRRASPTPVHAEPRVRGRVLRLPAPRGGGRRPVRPGHRTNLVGAGRRGVISGRENAIIEVARDPAGRALAQAPPE
ncbi:hypothetical protein [Streptomyces sp. MMG1121]|uniref:hypothetical protein n=1 Tax=Streptomyces sp. MMG1121 TaxID=1415544 RepID=UPI000B330B18|nr:hypothetical protein [Streptomyces sp. MMG1121]